LDPEKCCNVGLQSQVRPQSITFENINCDTSIAHRLWRVLLLEFSMARTAAARSSTNSKSICMFFYNEVTKTEWQCKKCLRTKSKNGGWTNLLSHVRSCVGSDYEKVFQDARDHAGKSPMNAFFVRVSDQEKEMNRWIRFVVMRNLPVSIVDCPYTRDIGCGLKPVSGRTLRRNILALRDVMKNTLRKELPSRFAVVFDGWSEGTQHYIGVAASYIKKVDDTEVSVQTMLSMRPLLADGVKGMRAVDHIDHLTRVLESYGKNEKNVVCLVGDNCAVNQSMARIMNVPLLGCASHKFNLAVRRWISEQEELNPIIAKVSIFVVVVVVVYLFIVSCANVFSFCR
jgi:hypothetical protein